MTEACQRPNTRQHEREPQRVLKFPFDALCRVRFARVSCPRLRFGFQFETYKLQLEA